MPLEFDETTGLPIAARGTSPIRIILQNPDGVANGDNKETDTESVAVSTAINGSATSVRYGVAYASRGGEAHAGALGAAVAHSSGGANSGDGGIAFAWNGIAKAGIWAVAYARKGVATTLNSGVAVTLLGGVSKTLKGGVAVALNYRITNDRMVTDSTVGVVAAGKQSVLVAFRKSEEEPDDSDRRPVVGIIGEKPAGIDSSTEALLLTLGVQFGLEANTPYRLDKTGKFEKVT